MEPLCHRLQRAVWRPHHSLWSPLTKPAFEPRNLIVGSGNLEQHVTRSQGLIGDNAAEAEDFSLSLIGLSSHNWQDIIQTLQLPFPMDFSKNYREEVLQAGQGRSELFGVRDTRPVGQFGKNRPERAADNLLCSGCHYATTPAFGTCSKYPRYSPITLTRTLFGRLPSNSP